MILFYLVDSYNTMAKVESLKPTELLKAVQVDHLAGGKSLDVPKIDSFSDINSDLNFLANAKKTFPVGQVPKSIKTGATSPLQNEILPDVTNSGENNATPPSPPSPGEHSSDGLGSLGDHDFDPLRPNSAKSDEESHNTQPLRDLPTRSIPNKVPTIQRTKPMTEEEVRREKAFLLFQYESKNKDFRYSKTHLTMNSSLEDIKNEIELINSKRAMETNMSFWRRGMVLFSEGLVYLNNTFDPFSVEMSDWSKQMAYEVMEEKSYDELLEELVMKYKSTGVSAPVEIRLALAVGASFGFGVMAKKREMAILEKLQHTQHLHQNPPPFSQPRQQHTHGPSMNADDVIKMMQQDGVSVAESDIISDTDGAGGSKGAGADEQSVITVPTTPKKRGRKPKAKEPEMVLKL